MGNHCFKFLSSWCFLKHLSAKMQAWWKKKGEGSPSKTLLSSHQRISANTHTNTYVYIYICTFTCVCIYIYTYLAPHCIALHYIAVHYIALHYATLHHATLHYITSHHIASHYTALHHVTCITCKCDIFIYIYMCICKIGVYIFSRASLRFAQTVPMFIHGLACFPNVCMGKEMRQCELVWGSSYIW